VCSIAVHFSAKYAHVYGAESYTLRGWQWFFIPMIIATIVTVVFYFLAKG